MTCFDRKTEMKVTFAVCYSWKMKKMDLKHKSGALPHILIRAKQDGKNVLEKQSQQLGLSGSMALC